MKGSLKYRKEGQLRWQQRDFVLTPTHQLLLVGTGPLPLDEHSRLRLPDGAHRFEIKGCASFQANNESEATQWAAALRFAICNVQVMTRPSIAKTVPIEDILPSLRPLPGNDRCADCGGAGPEVASLAFAVLICVKCAEVHASYPHRTRIQHLNPPLSLSTRCPAVIAQILGGTSNEWQNRHLLPGDSVPIIGPHSSRLDRARHIHAKYFAAVASDEITRIDSLPSDLKLLWQLLIAQGASPNSRHTLTQGTLLHLAVRQNALSHVALLMWSGADARLQDDHGLTPLDLALKMALDEVAEMIVREDSIRASNTI